ncbi:hypothetical protein BST97_12300 [Nonlabens spongiae]|uniref:Outer membrane protein beta-barrel domain-containing protein n=1 Tax=Nonlabens spongiae TaxID=331648 RepID=A0A1W6MM86_9FLAO|nr:hypothetical protein [Nonlabens spongiae]ARN78710.1 hypothetical protein BST97_12300 [Nonlabens spongiae]
MKICLWVVFVVLAFAKAYPQGPPITADKPIMLGGNSFTMKTLTEIRNTERGTAAYVPVMLHYLPTANSLVALHVPLISYDLNGINGTDLADMKVMGKYQFYRKDGTGKTFRMVAKTLQTLPTGAEIDLVDISTGKYSGYYGVVSGYETLKYGISTEVGYNWMPDGTLDEFRTKLGFGLPLLKPQYPNKQLNLYFEYSSMWLHERDWYQLLYAQGVQYAMKNITLDLALQLPLVQDVSAGRELNYSLFIGARYTF